MPRKKKPVDDSELLHLDAFAKQVESALLHYDDPAWLGKHSSLAQPWVLGAHLQGRSDGNQERGTLLRELVVEAAAELTDPEEQSVVHAGYLKRDPYLTNAGVALRLGMNERQFFRKRAAAVRNMAISLYRRLISPLRLESPPVQVMSGRHRERAQMLDALRPGKSVCLAGPSGIGKSTLAADVAAATGAATFWFTVRPGFNDNLESLLFALAWFLRQQGAHNLWLQIVADSHDLDSERIAGLLRFDLSALPAGSFLICIDEVDLLNSDEAEHAHMLHVIEVIRPIAPLLFMGQRAVMESTTLLNLGALPDAELKEWHATLGSELLVPFETLRRLTQGIPVLLTAWLILAHSDPAYATLMDDSRPITLESVFQRVWRKLPGDERMLIGELAIHGGGAPAEILTVGNTASGTEAQTLARLRERALIFEPTAGYVQLPTYLAKLVQEHMDAEARTMLHLRVAGRLEERGLTVDAVHHWIAGGRPEIGLWLWFRHRISEVNRGNATRAHLLLNAVNPDYLPQDNDRTALQIALAELQIHLELADDAQKSVALEPRHASTAVRSHLAHLRGDVADMLDNAEQALDYYRESLDGLLGSAEQREAETRACIGLIQRARKIDLDQALADALYFRFRAEVTHASVEELLGNYDEASQRYQVAIGLTERIPESDRERARLYLAMSTVEMVTGQIDRAIAHMQASIAYYEEIGALPDALTGISNLAYAYLQAGDAASAMTVLEPAIPRARRMRSSYILGGLTSCAAEAHLALGDLDQAESFAVEAVQQEDEFYQHWALAVYAQVRSRRGAHDEARMLALQGLDSAKDTGNPYSIGYCERKVGEVLQAAGATSQAHEWYRQARETYARVGLENEVKAMDGLIASLEPASVANAM